MVSRRKKRIKDKTGPFLSFFSPVGPERKRGWAAGQAMSGSLEFTPRGLLPS